MIDGTNFFDQPIKNYIKTYDNIRKSITGQEMSTQLVVCYITNISKKHYKMIEVVVYGIFWPT